MKASKAIIASILAILIVVAVQVFATILAYFLARTGLPLAAANMVHAFFYISVTYALIKIITEKYLKMDMEEIGVADIRVSPKWFIISFAMPTVVFGIYLVIPGTMHITDLSEQALWDVITEGVFMAGLAAGLIEELVFRGVMMTSFEKAFGKWAAFIIPSFAFSIFYVVGSGLSPISTVHVIVAGTIVGLMFSFVAYEESNIWNSVLLHTIWNMVMIGGIFTIGGQPNFKAKFTYVLETKNSLITGGDFGVESSIISILAYIIVAIIAYMGLQKTGFHYKEKQGNTIKFQKNTVNSMKNI